MNRKALAILCALVTAIVGGVWLVREPPPVGPEAAAGSVAPHAAAATSSAPTNAEALVTDVAGLPPTSAASVPPSPATAALAVPARESATRPAPDAPTLQVSLSADAAASASELLFLCFGMEDGRLSLLSRARVKGNMRLPPTVEPVDGLYHRLLSASGQVLAQGTTPDPRPVHFDYPNPDGSGRLTGGVVVQSNVQFVVRYPWIPGTARLEFFRVGRDTALATLTTQGDRYEGVFDVAISGP